MVIYSKAGNKGRRFGLFSKNGLRAMLHVSGLYAIENISSLLGIPAPLLCGLSPTAVVICAVTKYVDIVTFVFRSHTNIDCTVKIIQILKRRIQLFRNRCVIALGKKRALKLLT